jgi:hypothetical protein
MSSGASTFVCSTCGKSHEGLPTDQAYELPDIVWAIPGEERQSRAKWTKDLCQLGERYFIRCLLQIPFTEREGHFGWGIWVEVEWPVFERYLEVYEEDATSEPEVCAAVANDLPGYEPAVGTRVFVQFGTSANRPTVRFPDVSTHSAAVEQKCGINEVRYHQILESLVPERPGT